jgi:GT2 family glycosyltransferase
MENKPLVSIVMAAYNSAPYLPEAIRSVTGQTYPHWELHIINDGSKDNTAEVVRPFLDDPRIIYHEQENKGQAIAKNAACVPHVATSLPSWMRMTSGPSTSWRSSCRCSSRIRKPAWCIPT